MLLNKTHCHYIYNKSLKILLSDTRIRTHNQESPLNTTRPRATSQDSSSKCLSMLLHNIRDNKALAF